MIQFHSTLTTQYLWYGSNSDKKNVLFQVLPRHMLEPEQGKWYGNVTETLSGRLHKYLRMYLGNELSKLLREYMVGTDNTGRKP